MELNQEFLMVAQCQSLDILLWVIGYWKIDLDRLNKNWIIKFLKFLISRSAVLSVSKLFLTLLNKIILNGYINAPRTISYKWNLFIYEFLEFVL